MRTCSRVRTWSQWSETAAHSGVFLLLWLTGTSVGRTQDFAYTNNNGRITITGYTGPDGAVTIPRTLDGLPVTVIGFSAFSLIDAKTGQNSLRLTSVTIPDSVTTIKNNAFDDSPYLGSISLGNGVTTIENGAFGDCNALTNVNLPSSATNITHPFDYCNSLTSITVDPLNPVYSSAGGVLLNKEQTTVIEFPAGKLGSYVIPDGITGIADGAFTGCNLTSLTIPHGVTNIGIYAFAYSQELTSVAIPNSVTNIGSYAFLDCARLVGVSIPEGVATIGDYTFASCSRLTNTTIPKSLTSIGNDAFSGCGRLTGIYFKGNAPSVFLNTFQFDNTTTVYYLPGTTGWGATFGGRPAMLWNPQAQTTGDGFGVRQNQFRFDIAGTADIPLVIEATADLGITSWITLQSCRLTNGLLHFSDPQWTNYPGRFYRIRSP